MSRRTIPRRLLVPDPVLHLPTKGQLRYALEGTDADWDRLMAALEKRAQTIENRMIDPLQFGYRPDFWKDVRRYIEEGYEEVTLFGANREGKTEGACELVCSELVAEKREWACFHNTARTSEQQQQRRIFRYLPPEFRDMAVSKGGKRTASTYLKFTEAGGFANDTFILPGTGSQCSFFNYGQRSEVWEGPEYDGGWFDEGVTLPVLETFRFRRGKGRRLLVLVTFTPKWGFTPTVQNLVAGAEVLETRPAVLLDPDKVHVKGCPPGHMPYVLRGRMERHIILFCHNKMNPFGAGEEVAKALVGAPPSKIKIRAYGWADRSVSGAFPKFGKAHVVTRERVIELLRGPHTMYVACDGATGKNWFFQWWIVTPEGWRVLVWEWPDKPTYDEWALSPAEVAEGEGGGTGVLKRNDWRPGPAQHFDAGRGISSYKALLLETEGMSYDRDARQWVPKAAVSMMPVALRALHEGAPRAWTVERRVMDPRFGGAPVPSEDEATIISLMGEDRNVTTGERMVDSMGREVPAMEWEQAPGGNVEAGVEQVGGLMDWNEAEPLSRENCPKLYVSEDCEQSRIAFAEYTTSCTKANALREAVDCARYFVTSGCGYVEATQRAVKRHGRGHY